MKKYKYYFLILALTFFLGAKGAQAVGTSIKINIPYHDTPFFGSYIDPTGTLDGYQGGRVVAIPNNETNPITFTWAAPSMAQGAASWSTSMQVYQDPFLDGTREAIPFSHTPTFCNLNFSGTQANIGYNSSGSFTFDPTAPLPLLYYGNSTGSCSDTIYIYRFNFTTTFSDGTTETAYVDLRFFDAISCSVSNSFGESVPPNSMYRGDPTGSITVRDGAGVMAYYKNAVEHYYTNVTSSPIYQYTCPGAATGGLCGLPGPNSYATNSGYNSLVPSKPEATFTFAYPSLPDGSVVDAWVNTTSSNGQQFCSKQFTVLDPPVVINGTCENSTTNQTFPFSSPPPSNILCAHGTPSSVTANPTTYTWSCEGSGPGHTDAACSAGRAAAPASADLKVNGLDNPPQISHEGAARVTWCGPNPEQACANATGCTVSMTGVATTWSGTSGDQTQALTTSRTYTLICNPGGTTDIVSVDVASPPVTHTFTLEKIGQGTVTAESDPSQPDISCGLDCPTDSADYIEETEVTLTAYPGPGRIFAGWTGCDGTPLVTPSMGTCEVSVDAVETVVAKFILSPAFGEF